MQSSPPADPSSRPSAGSAALPNLVAASWLALPWALQAAGSSFPQQAALLWMAGSVGLFLVAPAVAGWMGGRGAS